eukprot:jgi/Bigna1/66768/fgenesh1_pg.2_\
MVDKDEAYRQNPSVVCRNPALHRDRSSQRFNDNIRTIRSAPHPAGSMSSFSHLNPPIASSNTSMFNASNSTPQCNFKVLRYSLKPETQNWNSDDCRLEYVQENSERKLHHHQSPVKLTSIAPGDRVLSQSLLLKNEAKDSNFEARRCEGSPFVPQTQNAITLSAKEKGARQENDQHYISKGSVQNSQENSESQSLPFFARSPSLWKSVNFSRSPSPWHVSRFNIADKESVSEVERFNVHDGNDIYGLHDTSSMSCLSSDIISDKPETGIPKDLEGGLEALLRDESSEDRKLSPNSESMKNISKVHQTEAHCADLKIGIENSNTKAFARWAEKINSFKPPQTDSRIQKFKTEMCSNWISTGRCIWGMNCDYAHGLSELKKSRLGKHYKSMLCPELFCHECHNDETPGDKYSQFKFNNGSSYRRKNVGGNLPAGSKNVTFCVRSCKYGNRCTFAHPGDFVRRSSREYYMEKILPADYRIRMINASASLPEDRYSQGFSSIAV